MKTQTTREGEKILANHIFDKGFVSRIYKEISNSAVKIVFFVFGCPIAREPFVEIFHVFKKVSYNLHTTKYTLLSVGCTVL